MYIQYLLSLSDSCKPPHDALLLLALWLCTCPGVLDLIIVYRRISTTFITRPSFSDCRSGQPSISSFRLSREHLVS